MIEPYSFLGKKSTSLILSLCYWMLIFTQITALRSAGIPTSERSVYVDYAALARVGVIVLTFFVMICLFLLGNIRPLRVWTQAPAQRMILLFLGVSGIACLWSPMPLVAAFRIFQLLVSAMLVWLMVSCWHEDELHGAIWKLCLPVLVFGFFNGLFSPGKQEIYEAGFISYFQRFKENAGGHVAAIAMTDSLSRIVFKTSNNFRLSTSFLHFCLAGISLALFQSAYGLFLLEIAIVVLLLRSGRIYLICFAVSVLVATLFYFDPFSLMAALTGGRAKQNILSLSGRLDLYPLALKFAWQAPIWGHGFLADSLLSQFEGDLGWLPQNAHNGYLSAFLNFGVIGFFVLLLTLVTVARNLKIPSTSRLQWASDVFRFRLAFFLLLMGNLFESWIGDKFTLLWPMFCGLALIPILINRQTPLTQTNRGTKGP